MRKFEFHSYGIQNEEYHVINTEEHQNFVMLNPRIALTKEVESDLFLMSKAPELLDILKEILSSEWIPLSAFNPTVSKAKDVVRGIERGCNSR